MGSEQSHDWITLSGSYNGTVYSGPAGKDGRTTCSGDEVDIQDGQGASQISITIDPPHNTDGSLDQGTFTVTNINNSGVTLPGQGAVSGTIDAEVLGSGASGSVHIQGKWACSSDSWGGLP